MYIFIILYSHRITLPLFKENEGKRHLGIKKKQAFFVLLSIYITFIPQFFNKMILL